MRVYVEAHELTALWQDLNERLSAAANRAAGDAASQARAQFSRAIDAVARDLKTAEGREEWTAGYRSAIADVKAALRDVRVVMGDGAQR